MSDVKKSETKFNQYCKKNRDLATYKITSYKGTSKRIQNIYQCNKNRISSFIVNNEILTYKHCELCYAIHICYYLM